ncbi:MULTISPECIES: hypothetical protein [unclassified Salinibacterium]|uniref:magnesium chelatase subunit ChlI family protein n=1 Tax=Salinibacterium sp. dk2585 TaxID=2603292 RepID=UPI002107DD35|nr:MULTISPECIES: hypothetical protein [unclassified Salinibacterium]
MAGEGGTSSDEARQRVREARAVAADRLRDTPWEVNAHVPGTWLRSPGIRLPPTSTASLDRALERGGITMRGYDRVLRTAWTIADLDGAGTPSPDHVGRALFLRRGIT